MAFNGISPKSWAKMFPGAHNAVNFLNKNFITFTAYAPPSVKYWATSTQGAMMPSGEPLDSYSFYYPKNTIREEISHDYSPLEGAYADMLREAKGAVVDVARGVTAIQNLGSRTSEGILSEEPTYFLKSEKRRFDMTIDLYSISSDSANDDVYNPILFFKRYSHAIGRGPGGYEGEVLGIKVGISLTKIQFPGTFVLSGGLFENSALRPGREDRRHMVLKNMSVEYNPDIQFVDRDGYPVQARMTLSFEEIQSLFQGDWQGAQLKTSISTKGGK